MILSGYFAGFFVFAILLASATYILRQGYLIKLKMEPASNSERQEKKQKPRRNLLALPPSDGADSEVLATFTLVPDMAKKIEAVGEKHMKLQGKFYRAAQRKLAAEGAKDKRGKNLVVEDSEEEEEEKKGSGTGSDNDEAE